jgi:hypothetical protein
MFLRKINLFSRPRLVLILDNINSYLFEDFIIIYKEAGVRLEYLFLYYYFFIYPVKPLLAYGGNARMLCTGKTLRGRKPVSLGLSFISCRYRVDVPNYDRARRVFRLFLFPNSES